MLNSKQCEAFFTVAQTKSFDTAAKILNITASAVTLRVQQLEKSLGQLLIIRERPCRMSSAGESLFKYLQHCNQLEEQLIQQLNGQLQVGFTNLSIASNEDSISSWLMPNLYETLIDEKITLKVELADHHTALKLLETGKVNACISTEPETIQDCVSHKLAIMTYRIVSTPLFYENWFNKDDDIKNILTKAPAIFYNDESLLNKVLLSKYQIDIQSHPHHYIPSSSYLDAILSGIGYGMLPEIMVKSFLRDNKLIEILPECSKSVPLFWHQWKMQNSALEKITNILINDQNLF